MKKLTNVKATTITVTSTATTIAGLLSETTVPVTFVMFTGEDCSSCYISHLDTVTNGNGEGAVLVNGAVLPIQDLNSVYLVAGSDTDIGIIYEER